MTAPTPIFLHALGGSARAWQPVRDRLGDRAGIALDLPGFGMDGAEGDGRCGPMVDRVVAALHDRGVTDALLVGHSMGGKIATLLAARAQAQAQAQAQAGAGDVAGRPAARLVVRGVVLVAASPPAPEPIDAARRARMIGWFADGAPDRADAAAFVDANSATPLPEPWRERAIADVLAARPEAWLGWLERGSREDWRDRVGRIACPALIVAGSADGDLGAEAQRRLNLPHYPDAGLRIVAGAAHLIPYEQPEALAALIRDHAARCSLTPDP